MSNMKRCSILIFTILASLMISSCKDETSKWLDRVPIFKVLGPDGTENSEISIDGKSQSVDFTILTSEAWSAEIKGCDEYSLSATNGGAGRTTVSMKTPENESGAIRNATVNFISGERSYEFTLTQAIQEPYLETDIHNVSVSPYGEALTINVSTNQTSWEYVIEPASAVSWLAETSKDDKSVTFTVPENKTGAELQATITFLVTGKEELFDIVSVKQVIPASVPTDLILDVVFNESGAASDASPSKMQVDNARRDADVAVEMVSQFNRYAAVFKNGTIARSGLATGYYTIPYTADSDFGKKIADGCTYELVFCTSYDPLTYTDGLKQVKPFASTQAGGLGVCLQANSGKIQFECHVGGGWKSPASKVIPAANRFYHVIGVFDKANQSVSVYVDGVFQGSTNAAGDFKFMDTSVDKRWFGIGADPSNSDKGEASFFGKVAVARLYDAPMTEAQVMACYKEIME